MTDKQIDTCEFFDIRKAACGGTLEDTEMCHCYELYKHIARKEQECKNWQKELDKTHLLMLEKQNKLIKEFFNNEQLKLENTKYKQTLTEIKEIAKNMNKECFYDDFSCDGCDMINGCTYQCKIKALQKVSEVKE